MLIHLLPPAPAKRILNLRDPTQKMSKSAVNPNSRIILSDSADEVSQKIRKAVTDSDHDISYDPVARLGISNLLRLLYECRLLASSRLLPSPLFSETTGLRVDSSARSQIDQSSPIQSDDGDSDTALHILADTFRSAGKQTPQFKEAVVEAVNEVLAPIGAEFIRIRADEAYLRSVASTGAERARAIAQRTMQEVKDKVGLGYL